MIKTLFTMTTIILSTITSQITHAETTQESIAETQHKISEAAQSAANTASKLTKNAQDAFTRGLKEGKLESLLFFNTHLNGYKIDAEIQGNRAILTGQVAQSIEKDYAEQLALNIDGIHGVTNNIQVNNATKKSALNSTTTQISSTLKDATITASIKAKLIANTHISGLKINVDTNNKEVMLRGEARSTLERDLIEQIASNTTGVHNVINKIQVLAH